MSDPTQPPRDDEPTSPSPSSPFPESTLGPEQPAEPSPPPAAPPARPQGAGLVSGDPLWGAGSSPTPPAPTPAPGSAPPPAAYPPGYTSPPPPGAGGMAPVFGSAPAPGSHRLASWWSRAGATIIDGLIIGFVSLIFIVPLGIGAASSDNGGGTVAFVVGLILTILVFAVVGLFYAPVMMARTNGQTLGRMATGIRVIRADGQPMTFGFAALREIVVKALLVGVISSFTAGIAYLIDVLWPLWDDENRALHDFVVNTRVVKA